MGFNAVYLNPFHYPGFSGSLYAVKDYYRLNPRFRGGELGDDDALLREFTDAAGAQGLRVIMDLVVNHTSKDSELVATRPHWFARDSRATWSLRRRAIPPTRPRRRSGATSPSSISGRLSKLRSWRIFRSWCAITLGWGLAASAATRPIKYPPRCGAV